MYKRKMIWNLAVLLFSSVLVLGACGTQGKSNETGQKGESDEEVTKVYDLTKLGEADIDEIILMNFAGSFAIREKEYIKEIVEKAAKIEKGDMETRVERDYTAAGNLPRYIRFMHGGKIVCTLLYEVDGVSINGLYIGFNPPGFIETWNLCQHYYEIGECEKIN